jgi:predicted nuclease with TOPRIM domain
MAKLPAEVASLTALHEQSVELILHARRLQQEFTQLREALQLLRKESMQLREDVRLLRRHHAFTLPNLE